MKSDETILDLLVEALYRLGVAYRPGIGRSAVDAIAEAPPFVRELVDQLLPVAWRPHGTVAENELQQSPMMEVELITQKMVVEENPAQEVVVKTEVFKMIPVMEAEEDFEQECVEENLETIPMKEVVVEIPAQVGMPITQEVVVECPPKEIPVVEVAEMTPRQFMNVNYDGGVADECKSEESFCMVCQGIECMCWMREVDVDDVDVSEGQASVDDGEGQPCGDGVGAGVPFAFGW